MKHLFDIKQVPPALNQVSESDHWQGENQTLITMFLQAFILWRHGYSGIRQSKLDYMHSL